MVKVSEASLLKVKVPESNTGLLSLSVRTTEIGRTSLKSASGSPSLNVGDLIGLLNTIFCRIFSYISVDAIFETVIVVLAVLEEILTPAVSATLNASEFASIVSK